MDQASGSGGKNPYCSRCSMHLGKPFHETNEHDEALEIQRRKFKEDK